MGGTFTDIVGLASDGTLVTRKVLSHSPARYSDAAVHGMKQILGVEPNQSLPASAIALIKLGTTVATNALLERKGERTVLITTRGFADGLRIGYQNRPDIFARRIVLPEQFYETVVEADERVRADGFVEIALDERRLAGQLRQCREQGYKSCAIVFMHGYRDARHEIAAGKLAFDAGFEQISCSHEVSPLIKFVMRGETTVADAYLSPILRRYVQGFKCEVGEARVLFMQSNGGLVESAQFKGRNSLLSGPAGGVVGAAKSCAAVGIFKSVAF